MPHIQRTVLSILATVLCALGAAAQSTPRYLIVNNNHPGGNFATFFKLANNGTFVGHQEVQTGGKGIAGGLVSPAVATFHSAAQDCVFVSDAGTADVAAIDSHLKVAGRFQGGPSDRDTFVGISLAINQNFLYAAFTGKQNSDLGGTLASFAIQPGCKLQFLGSVPAVGTGLSNPLFRYPIALAAHGKILVVVYEDGSIESFHFTNGLAQSNGDLQNSSSAAMQAGNPVSVDITQDSHFAIFGDSGGQLGGARVGPNEPVGQQGGSVEVSDISTGKLKPTTIYNTTSVFSLYARLSPDESLIHMGGGEAAFFDKNTGVVTDGCFISLKDPMEGRTFEWWFETGVAFADNASGNGSTVYVNENTAVPGSEGNDQYVGFYNVVSNGTSCTLTESPQSNVEMQSTSADLGTSATWPPRAF
jgi:hypothetical protein